MSSPTNRQLIEDRSCNRLKGDKTAEELAEQTGPRTFVTSRTW